MLILFLNLHDLVKFNRISRFKERVSQTLWTVFYIIPMFSSMDVHNILKTEVIKISPSIFSK